MIDILVHHVTMATSNVMVTTTAPVDPVPEGGIFSIHCHVWNLAEGQEVTLLKKPRGGRPKRIALHGTIMVPDERMFLAVRQLNDGSLVYFLSVIEARRDDDLEYECKIIDTAGSINLPSDSIPIRVTYFPESDPECGISGGALTIWEGSYVSLNCSSVSAYPIVTLQWYQSGSSSVVRSEEVVIDDRSHSQMSFRASRQEHNNAVYICEVSSAAFPDRTKTCHVGPLKVIPTQDGESSLSSPPHKPRTNIGDPVLPNQDTDISSSPSSLHPPTIKRPPKTTDCSQVCLSTQSQQSNWILATIFTGSAAFIFLLLGLTLFVKYLNTRSSSPAYTRPRYIATQKGISPDGIYSELECKQGHEAKMMYMTLQTKQQALIVGAKDDNRSGRYDPMPQTAQ